MIAYIIRRLFQLVIVLIGVTFITFMMLKLVPGDPASPKNRRISLVILRDARASAPPGAN